MTKTEQARSVPEINKTGRNLTINNPETEENMRHLLLLFDKLDDYRMALTRLDYEVTKLLQKGGVI